MGDTYGQEAAKCPSHTNEEQLWPCPSGINFQGIISVVNMTDQDQSYSLAHCPAGHGDVDADPEHHRAKNVVVEPGSPPHEYSVNMNATESIRIQSNQASGVTFNIEGMRMVIGG